MGARKAGCTKPVIVPNNMAGVVTDSDIGDIGMPLDTAKFINRV